MLLFKGVLDSVTNEAVAEIQPLWIKSPIPGQMVGFPVRFAGLNLCSVGWHGI